MISRRTLIASTALAAVAVTSLPAFASEITGAGATFPFPLYAKWAEAYKAAAGVSLNYQSIGSGGGIRQIRARTVDLSLAYADYPYQRRIRII